MSQRGHAVTLYAGEGSQPPEGGDLIVSSSELALANRFDFDHYDAVLDTSHGHWLSKACPSAPVLNRLADLECVWQPPNVVTNSPFMKARKGGRLVNTGIRPPANDWFNQQPRQRIALFMSGSPTHKGQHTAATACTLAGWELNVQYWLPADLKWEALAMAAVLLHPSTIDAAPRLPLEAAMVGTPTICLNQDGAAYHVADQVTGFVCATVGEMVEVLSLGKLNRINPYTCREWADDEHGYEDAVAAYEALLTGLTRGERW
ncbi:glycosyltransferase [Staphylococcus aureus]|uniref:glycosyltransferase n=1 Tax=Staphylococcus aureus TaxID=1280 RepID=UPI0023B13598|nr:glycosyltransferase [Staphylococcus aureus]MDE8535476.1 glycosyltransferase [Staphylococcus aureus]